MAVLTGISGLLFILSYWLLAYFLLSRFRLLRGTGWLILIASLHGGTTVFGSIFYLSDLAPIFRNVNAAAVFLGAMLLINILLALRTNLLGQLAADIRKAFSIRAKNNALLVYILFAAWFFWQTFALTYSGDIEVSGAWSDITYHHAYIRTIARGVNVPVIYPYFANHTMGYHFMFQYVAGKVAQAGLNSVITLNMMSVIFLVSLFILTVELAEMLFRNIWVGFLANFFLICHGSLAFFIWLFESTHTTDIGEILKNSGTIAYTMYESYGLYNLNVLTAQRHFPFGLSFVLLMTLLTLRVRDAKPTLWLKSFDYGTVFLFSLLLGCMPFFNAPMAIAADMVVGLLSLAQWKKNRRAFKILFLGAAVGGAAIVVQLLLFRNNADALTGYPVLHIGYEAGNTVRAIVKYTIYTIGVKFILFVIAFGLIPKQKRYDMFVFLIPLILAYTVQLGVILYDNNKLMWVSMLYINLYASWVIVRLFTLANDSARIKNHLKPFCIRMAYVLALVCSATGLLELVAFTNVKTVRIEDKSSLTREWIENNTQRGDIFMSGGKVPYYDSAISAVNLAGRMLYNVSSDVDSSCDTGPRLEFAARVYEGSFGSVEETKNRLTLEKVNYIILDDVAKEWMASREQTLNEQFIGENFRLVFEKESLRIYAVN